MTKQRLWLVVQALVTLGFLTLVFRRFDWLAFGHVLGGLSPALYVGSLAAVVAGQLLYAGRWRMVLHGMGVNVSYPEIVAQYLIGIFFGNLMPTAVGGDAAKVYYLGRRTGYVEVGASVFVDRFLGFLWLSVIGTAIAWTVGAESPLFVLNRNLLSMFAALFLTMLAAAWLVPVERLIPTGLASGRYAPWCARATEFIGYVRRGGCRGRTLLLSGAVVFAYLSLMTMVYKQFFIASIGSAPAALPVMNVLVSMSIFINVPISVNGIGLREQLHALLFASLGVPKEVAVSLSLLMFSHSLVLSLVGYLVWMRARHAAVESLA